MSLYSTADLLRRCKVRLNRPVTDEAFTVSVTDDVWYDYLTEAQAHVMGLLAATCPEPMYNALTALTTADSGATFTFGTDVDAANIQAYGHFEVYPTLNSFPDSPLTEGVDFIWGGDKLIVPNGRTIDTPYARWITPPNVLSSSVEPTLKPEYARILIADQAVAMAAEQRLKQDSSSYEKAYTKNVNRVLLTMKTSAAGQGGRATAGNGGAWWRTSPDLG